MSSVPVYVGRWQDYSQKSLVIGDVVTLDVREAGYLIAALSTFVGFVGTALWSLYALVFHQCLAKDKELDGLDLQYRVLYRNSGSAASTILDIMKMCFAWRKSDGHARVKRLKLRSFVRILPPLIVFVGFAIAGVFVSEIAGKSYKSNDVRIAPVRCGSFVYDNTVEGKRALQQKIINDTLAGRAYADNCYSTSENIAQCSLFPTQAIQFSTMQVQCPFGTDASGKSLCLYNQSQAIQIDTGLLDTNDILGINTAPQNRILIRKMLTCSPINVTNYIVIDNSTDPVQLLNLGPIYDVSSYTYSYHTRTKSDGVGYQVFSIAAGPEVWTPIEPLQVLDGDVSTIILTSNSIRYLAPVEDIWFSATTPVDPGASLPTEYIADSDITAMGSVDQLQICNPATNSATNLSCTIISSWLDVSQAYGSIELNDYQLATAGRLLLLLADTSTFYSINGLGDNALLARRNLVQDISTGLPSNQWQFEARGWFETSLAKLQAYVIEQVTNIADLGPYGELESPDPNGNSIEQAAASFCNSQRVHNTGGYQTFSFLGLMVVFCVGVTVIITSWIFEPILGCLRNRASASGKHSFRESARTADHKFQLLRMALWGFRYKEGWEKLHDEVPVTRAGHVFAPLWFVADDEIGLENSQNTSEQKLSLLQRNGQKVENTDGDLTDTRTRTVDATVEEIQEGGENENVDADEGRNENVNAATTGINTDEAVNGNAETHVEVVESFSNRPSISAF